MRILEAGSTAAAHARIIKMANQIAMAFAASPEPEAATADHIAKFWDPRMRLQLKAALATGGLDPVARAAAERLVSKHLVD